MKTMIYHMRYDKTWFCHYRCWLYFYWWQSLWRYRYGIRRESRVRSLSCSRMSMTDDSRNAHRKYLESFWCDEKKEGKHRSINYIVHSRKAWTTSSNFELWKFVVILMSSARSFSRSSFDFSIQRKSTTPYWFGWCGIHLWRWSV